MKENIQLLKLSRNVTGMLGAAAMVAGLQPAQADEDWEWSPDEGYHEEEWYDPSDWFDTDESVEYEYDDYEYYDGYWDGMTWYDGYEYGSEFDTDYVWNDENDDWEVEYGDGEYDYSAEYEFDETTLLDTDDDQASGLQTGQMDSGQQNTETLEGTIEGVRKMNVSYSAGFEETHALARVSLDAGKTAVVDLGLASLVDQELSKGDQVTLRGAEGKISGRNVFVATELTSNGETMYIDRAIVRPQGQQGQQQGQQAGQDREQQFTLEGEIADTEVIQAGGQEQTLVKIRLQNGRAATVRLGSETSLDDLNLSQGDRIRVEGPIEQIEGKNVVDARSISVQGEPQMQG